MVINSIKIWLTAVLGSASIDIIQYFENFNTTAAAGLLQLIILVVTIILQIVLIKKNLKNKTND